MGSNLASSGAGDVDRSTEDVATALKSICLEYFDGGAGEDALDLLKKLSVDLLRLFLQGGNEDMHILRAAGAAHDNGSLRGLGNMSFSMQLSVLLFHFRQASFRSVLRAVNKSANGSDCAVLDRL